VPGVLLGGTTSCPEALMVAPVKPPKLVMVGAAILGVPLRLAATAAEVSLPSRVMVPPAIEPTVPASSIASMRLMGVAAVLLVVTLSLSAPVFAATPTLVCGVSVPPKVPGMVTLIGHVRVAFKGKLAAVPLLATQGPVTTTVAPAGVPALAVHVALGAAAGPALVHTTLPLSTAPGLAMAGKPDTATLMSLNGQVMGVARGVSPAAGAPVLLVEVSVKTCVKPPDTKLAVPTTLLV
jgi:hypothetical protein